MTARTASTHASPTASSHAGQVIVIDDDPHILDAFSRLLELEGFACQTYPSAGAYLKALGEAPAGPTQPCCVLCDVKMPELDGLQLQGHLKSLGHAPLVLMSGASGAQEAISGFREGAVDFLLKPIQADDLLAAVRKALNLCRQQQGQSARRQQVEQLIASLSPRELEVARMVAKGMTNLGISLVQGITLRTVKFHRQRLLKKLSLAGTAELVRLMQEYEGQSG